MKYTYEQFIRNINLYYLSDCEIIDSNLSNLLDELKVRFNYSKLYFQRDTGLLWYISVENYYLCAIQTCGSGICNLNSDVFNYFLEKFNLENKGTIYKIVCYYIHHILKDKYIDINNYEMLNPIYSDTNRYLSIDYIPKGLEFTKRLDIDI